MLSRLADAYRALELLAAQAVEDVRRFPSDAVAVPGRTRHRP